MISKDEAKIFLSTVCLRRFKSKVTVSFCVWARTEYGKRCINHATILAVVRGWLQGAWRYPESYAVKSCYDAVS